MESKEDSNSRSLVTADLARELNMQIGEIGRSLTDPADLREELTFFCECGCLAAVRLTLAAFDAAGGAWIEDHKGRNSRS